MTNSNVAPTETLYARLSTVEGFEHFWGVPRESGVVWQHEELNPELETYKVSLYDGYETSVVARGSSDTLRKEIYEWFQDTGRTASLKGVPSQVELLELLKKTQGTFKVSHDAVQAYKNHTHGVEDPEGWSGIEYERVLVFDDYYGEFEWEDGQPLEGQVYIETFIIEVCIPEGWYA